MKAAVSNQIALVFTNANKHLWSGKGKRKGKNRNNNNKRKRRAEREKTRKNNNKKKSRAERIKTITQYARKKKNPDSNIWNEIRYNEGNIGEAKELRVSSLSPSILIAFLG